MTSEVLHNGYGAPLRRVTSLAPEAFRRAVIERTRAGERLVALFGRPLAQAGVRLLAVLGHDHGGTLAALATEVSEAYPALTPECPEAHWFEREIAEQWAVRPDGHPWLKPIRFHPPYRSGGAPPLGAAPAIGVTDFFRMAGEEVHEVAVGPVHAGIIEPGHFRFQCHGESVHHLEISLGYQHRGAERAFVAGPEKRAIHYAETLAGDTTIAHASAYCQALEALSHCRVPARAVALRGIALELERLANHTGDLGALANDVGFLPTASFCGRIRGDFLNMTALLCGNRFGRGLVRPGGVTCDLEPQRAEELGRRLERARRDVTGAVELLFETPSVMARFEETGRLTATQCIELGIVGPPARAAGLERDVRHDYPSGIFRFAHIPVSTADTGDVFARAFVRWLEIRRSLAFIGEQLRTLPEGPLRAALPPLVPEWLTVSLIEGWRGEVCHVAESDGEGRLATYKVVDASFHNWFGLAMALREQAISDFPLCNKSFNLSYCGHDL